MWKTSPEQVGLLISLSTHLVQELFCPAVLHQIGEEAVIWVAWGLMDDYSLRPHQQVSRAYLASLPQ